MSTFMNTATTNLTPSQIAFEMGRVEGAQSVYSGRVAQSADAAWDLIITMTRRDADTEYLYDDAFEQNFLDGWADGQKDAAS